MKLLTKELREQLLANGREQAKVKGTKAERDFPPVVKFFYPAGAATWLISEADPDDPDLLHGLAIWVMAYPNSAACALANCKVSAAPAALASSATSGSRPKRRFRGTPMPRAKPVTSSNR